MTNSSPYLVRLRPRSVYEIPSHVEFTHLPSASTSGDRPELLDFIDSLLKEAIEFTDVYLPAEFKKKSTKQSGPATAKVDLLEHSRDRDGLIETWFARRSRHVNTNQSGTATWEELDMGLRQDHSTHEMDYTPEVFDAHKVLDWNEQINDARKEQDSRRPTEYDKMSLSMYEMCHALPAPLQPRVFSIIVATAKTGPDSFVVVQIPVDIRHLEIALYSNGRHVTQGDTALKRKPVVIGLYTSIERCRMMDTGETEWIMATASDAKGNLPMWMQRMGTPGAVVKDVGLFMEWIAKQRK